MTNVLTTSKTPEEKESHAQAKAHAHAHAQAQAKAHTQAKRHMQLHEVDSISLSKKLNSEKKMICKIQKNKWSTRQSSIVSPGSSKMTPNILKVNSRVPQTQDKSH